MTLSKSISTSSLQVTQCLHIFTFLPSGLASLCLSGNPSTDLPPQFTQYSLLQLKLQEGFWSHKGNYFILPCLQCGQGGIHVTHISFSILSCQSSSCSVVQPSEDPHSLEDNFFPFSFLFWVIPDDAQNYSWLYTQEPLQAGLGGWVGILSTRDRIQISQFQGKNFALYYLLTLWPQG